MAYGNLSTTRMLIPRYANKCRFNLQPGRFVILFQEDLYCNHLSFVILFQEDFPPSPVTMHLLPAPDLANQPKNREEEDVNLANRPNNKEEPDEKQPSLQNPDKSVSPRPRRRNYQQREKKPARRTRKRTSPTLLAAWKRFTPTKLLKKAKMMLRSVQSE